MSSSNSSTLPVPIRRAGPGETVDRSTLNATPGGVNFFGSTPGGTKIMYSREQLLALSTSPLAKSPAQGLAAIPAQISKSPEKSANFGAHMAAIRRSSAGENDTEKVKLGGGTAKDPDAARGVFGASTRQPDSSSTQQTARKSGEEQFEMDL